MSGGGGWRALGRFWLVTGLALVSLAVAVELLPETPVSQVQAPAPDIAAEAPATPAAASATPALATPEQPRAATQATAAPDPDLLEAGSHGPLPRIAADGRTSMRVYARPMEPRDGQRPRISVILGGVGLNPGLADMAVQQLPPGIVLAINPYSPRLANLLTQARARGFEMLVALPMESRGHPQNDVGERALLTTLDPAVNRDRLSWILSRFQGYVGAIGALGPLRGERFAALGEPFLAMQDNLRARGLLYVDARPGARNPERAWGRTIDIVVDESGERGAIDLNLAALERMARERGTAIGLASDASPILIERLARWSQGLEERGFTLAPISALIQRPVLLR